MQHDEAIRLNQSTTKEQKENCQHSYEKEYYLGADTGDYVCKKCGNTLWKPDYEEWLKNQKK